MLPEHVLALLSFDDLFKVHGRLLPNHHGGEVGWYFGYCWFRCCGPLGCPKRVSCFLQQLCPDHEHESYMLEQLLHKSDISLEPVCQPMTEKD